MARRRRYGRPPVDPIAAEEERRRLIEKVNKSCREEMEKVRIKVKTPKPIPESPATDFSLFGLVAILGTIGAAVITIIITAQERPGALIPIWLFFEGPMFLSLGLAANQIFVKPQPPTHSAPIRWFTAYGMFTAVANALVALLTGITRVVSG